MSTFVLAVALRLAHRSPLSPRRTRRENSILHHENDFAFLLKLSYAKSPDPVLNSFLNAHKFWPFRGACSVLAGHKTKEKHGRSLSTRPQRIPPHQEHCEKTLHIKHAQRDFLVMPKNLDIHTFLTVTCLLQFTSSHGHHVTDSHTSRDPQTTRDQPSTSNSSNYKNSHPKNNTFSRD